VKVRVLVRLLNAETRRRRDGEGVQDQHGTDLRCGHINQRNDQSAVVRDTSQAAVIFDTSPDFTAPRRVAASGSWVDPAKEYEDRILTFQLSEEHPQPLDDQRRRAHACGRRRHEQRLRRGRRRRVPRVPGVGAREQEVVEGRSLQPSDIPWPASVRDLEIDYGAAATSPTVRFRGRRGEEDGTKLENVEEVFTLEFPAANTFSGF
jgi:hypothetical protein